MDAFVNLAQLLTTRLSYLYNLFIYGWELSSGIILLLFTCAVRYTVKTTDFSTMSERVLLYNQIKSIIKMYFCPSNFWYEFYVFHLYSNSWRKNVYKIRHRLLYKSTSESSWTNRKQIVLTIYRLFRSPTKFHLVPN